MNQFSVMRLGLFLLVNVLSIVLPSFSTHPVIEERLRSDDFLSKPVDKTELRTRVQTLLKVKAYNDYMQGFQERLAQEVNNRTKKLQEAYSKIQAALEEKEALIQEIHHRVKNNLQLISSLLCLQSAHLNDSSVQSIFHTFLNRINTMALVYECLYRQGDLSRIDLAAYLKDLISQMQGCFSSQTPNVQIHLDVQPMSLDISRAMPCGLIFNELITNAMKHAFADGALGHIFVSLKTLDSGCALIQVRDDGVGLPKGIDFSQAETLGIQLVTALVLQLKGILTLNREKGTDIRITFSLD